LRACTRKGARAEREIYCKDGYSDWHGRCEFVSATKGIEIFFRPVFKKGEAGNEAADWL
jgi:hypothetical protein